MASEPRESQGIDEGVLPSGRFAGAVEPSPPLALGPSWTLPGLELARGRYPLRVETHMGRLVDGLVPGVITTTWHPRSFGLHTLAWAEAQRRKLGREESEAFVRRCEVVLAAIWLAHINHTRPVPRAHGSDAIEKRLQATGVCDVAELSEPGIYAKGKRGFAGVYFASEVQLGLLSRGWPPKPPQDLDLDPLRDALGRVVVLAERDQIDLKELDEYGDLCVCRAAEGADGELMRHVVAKRIRDGKEGKPDSARIATVGLLASLVRESPEGSLEDAFRHRYAQGPPNVADLNVAAWQGAILRSYSVGAWRRLWSCIVDYLTEPRSLMEVGAMLAESLGTVTAGELFDDLPKWQADGEVLPVEEELRGDGAPNPRDDLRLLALGAARLATLDEGPTRQAFVGVRDEDDLGPTWASRWLERARRLPTRVFAQELVVLLVHRAERIALEKMEMRKGQAWIPTRINERDSLYWAEDREPYDDVTLRIDALGLMLLGLGIFQRDGQRWSLADGGDAYLRA